MRITLVVNTIVLRGVLSIMVALPFVNRTIAGDWPQILGPNRDGIAVDETLLTSWARSGPNVLWSRPAGQGFAGVAVVGDNVLLFHRVGAEEILECCSARTGEAKWKAGATCGYRSGMSSDSGPRCVPVVAAGHVVTFGVAGILRCNNLETGAEVWKRDTQAEFSQPEGYFGAGSTPVIFQDHVLVNVGSRNDAAVVAFSLKDGTTVWKSFADTASYSSPVITTINEKPVALFVTRLNLVGLNPVDGAVSFSSPFGLRGPTVNGANPVVIGDSVLLSSSYRIGSKLLKLNSRSVTEIWADEVILATQYATPIAYQGLIFAVDNRQDAGPGAASLKCIDPIRKKILWEESGFDYGSQIRVNDELLFLTCEGNLIRYAASAEGFQTSHRSAVLNSTPRGYRLPAISDGRLLVRDDDTLKCLQVGMIPSR